MQQITRTVFTAIILGSVFLVPVAGLSLSHAATVHARHSATLLPVSTPTRAWAEELNAKASFKYPQSAFFRDWIGN